jgi:hypothetical protein
VASASSPNGWPKAKRSLKVRRTFAAIEPLIRSSSLAATYSPCIRFSAGDAVGNVRRHTASGNSMLLRPIERQLLAEQASQCTGVGRFRVSELHGQG